MKRRSVFDSLTDLLLIGTGADFAVLNLFVPGSDTTVTKSISGEGKLIRLASRILNFDIFSGGWKVDKTARKLLSLEKFTRIGSLTDTAANQLPTGSLQILERTAGIRGVYGRGLHDGFDQLGNLLVFYSEPEVDGTVLGRLDEIAACIEGVLPALIRPEMEGLEDSEPVFQDFVRLASRHEGVYIPAGDAPHPSDFTPDVYLGLNKDLTIVFANHAVKVLGAERLEVTGSSIFTLFSAEMGARLRPQLETLRDKAERGRASRTLTIESGNNRRFRVVITRHPPDDPEKSDSDEILTLVLREISKEHRLSTAFLQQEEMLRQLADTMSEAVWIETIEPHQIIYTNPQFTPLFGIDPAELVRNPSSLIDRLKGIEKEQLKPAVNMEAGHPSQIECMIMDTSRQERWIRLRSYPILNPDTQPLFIRIAEDITRQKKAQETLTRQYSEARVLLHEMNHRIKNNLSVVAGLTGIAAGRITDPRIREQFEELENKISSIALVHELLGGSPDNEYIEFDAYCTNLIEILGPVTREGVPIRLETSLESHSIPSATAGVLGLMLTELLMNAAKHAFPHGDISPAMQLIFKSRLLDGKKGFMLSVRDNGVPIPNNPLEEKSSSRGMEILLTLNLQIKGQISFTQEKEWKSFTLSWPGT